MTFSSDIFCIPNFFSDVSDPLCNPLLILILWLDRYMFFQCSYPNMDISTPAHMSHSYCGIKLYFPDRFCIAKYEYSFLSGALFVCSFGFLTSSSTTRLYRGRAPRQERLTILRAATHETELGDHDFCLSRSHYTDTDPTCRERAATAGIEPGTSSPGVARSTAELPRPP